MNKSYKNLAKLCNYFLVSLSIVFFLYYFLNNLRNNMYEVLFIDERMLIDDIYNVWLLEDLYDRFLSISNTFIKNILIVFIEIAYGGDLRYGRLWSNIFIFFVGPFTLINDEIVILVSRLLNSLMFLLGAYLMSKNTEKKAFLGLSIFLIYSLPSVEYFHRIPKPDTLVFIFIALGISFLIKKKYYLSIFFLGIASFIKINAIVVFAILWIFIFQEFEEKKVKLFFRSIGITLGSLVLVNPILIVPPLTIGNIELPNFLKIYLNWLTTQSSNGDEIFFSLQNVNLWFETFSDFYKIPNTLIFYICSVSLILFIFRKIILSNDKLSKYLFFIFLIYLVFYFGFIERQYTHYLHLPIAILIIGYLRVLKPNEKNILPIIIILTLGIIGNLSNFSKFTSDIRFNANDRYGYESIEDPSDAKNLVDKVIQSIERIYESNENLNRNLVYWHPDLFVPRNDVTYNSKFYVREYWGDKTYVDSAINEADIYVTYTDYEISNKINKIKIENIYIYFYKN